MIRLFTKTARARLSSYRTLEHVRFISQTQRIYEKSDSSKQTSTPVESQSSSSPTADTSTTDASQPWQKKSQQRTLTNFDKHVLVSSGKYKTKDEIPDKVAHETLDRARDRYRVKMCIYMMIACTFICIVQVVRGKQAAERGESVVKSNLDWHKQYNEAAAKKEK